MISSIITGFLGSIGIVAGGVWRIGGLVLVSMCSK